MIQKNLIEVESDWQKDLAKAFKSPIELLNYLQIDSQAQAKNNEASKLFPMIVPRFFASLMQKGDINDPLLKQVLPVFEEFKEVQGFSTDPLLEQNTTQSGLVHKYKNRVLLIVKGGCAVNCRYCFRRHFPYRDNHLNKQNITAAIKQIEQDTQVNEVIFSGGDPLMAKNTQLLALAKQLEKISHIKRLRIHTRLPVVLPKRIDEEFCQVLAQVSLQQIIVLHINHANELSEALMDKVQRLKSLGVNVLNQAVLLKGVNDDVQSQIQLNEALYDAGIQAYYLHLLDKVQGAAHFDVPETKAVQIMQEVLATQSGYMVPKLVREIGGEASKTTINLN